jgi:hypothetical protein
LSNLALLFNLQLGLDQPGLDKLLLFGQRFQSADRYSITLRGHRRISPVSLTEDLSQLAYELHLSKRERAVLAMDYAFEEERGLRTE